MAPQRASFEWTITAQLKGNPSNDQILTDAKSVMTAQTVKTFTDEMAKRGVYDYKFRSVSSEATIVTRQLVALPYGIGLRGVQNTAKVNGSTIIEFDDIPVAIAAIVAAIAVAITAHAGLIVIVGIVAFVAILACVIFHVVVTDITTGISATGESVKTATSTTGGSIAVVALAIAALVLGVVLAWKWLKSKGSGLGKLKNWRY